jgi:hypothetical protein
MPGSQQDRQAAREGHRSRLVVPEDLRAAGIHLAEAGEGSHPVVPEVRRNRLAVPEEVGPTENSC